MMAKTPTQSALTQGWLAASESCALLGISRMELHRRTKPGDPHFIISKREGGRRLFALASFPFEAQQRFHERHREERSAIQAMPQSPQETAQVSPPASSAAALPDAADGQMPLEYPRTELERAFAEHLSVVAQTDPVSVPALKERFYAFQPAINHDYARTHKTLTLYARETAAKIGPRGISENHFWRLLKAFRDPLKTANYAAAFEALKVNRPGPASGAGALQTREIASSGPLTLYAGGTNQNVTLIPSGTGLVVDGAAAGFATSSAIYGPSGISSGTAIGISAGGTNQNITLTPSGTGLTTFNGNVGIGTASVSSGQKLEINGGLALNTATAKPTCSSTTRGTFWVAQGGASVKDSVEVCAKDSGDAYAWRTIY